MPLDRDRFETAVPLKDPPTSARIIRFLSEHADTAYTRGEIADAIDVNPETVGTNLTRLKNRGLVRHRSPYWAITEDREQVSNHLRDRYGDALNDPLDFGTTNETEDGGETDDAAPPADSAETGREHDADPATDTNPSSPVAGHRPHRAAARAYIERVRDRFEATIEELYLFGSVAQSTETAESDVDIMVVIATDADYAAVDDRLLDIAYDIQLEYGVRIEVHSIRADEFAARNARGDPFIRRVVREGQADV